ncbi:terpene cyclase, partial [Nanoarchaeota archaeon]
MKGAKIAVFIGILLVMVLPYWYYTSVNDYYSFSNGKFIVHTLEKDLIEEKVEDGKEYLFRVLDDDYHGVHKYYYATTDTFENRLHSIYTASTAFTLFKIYGYNNDKEVMDQILKSGEFILSMQNKKKDKGYGAFHYSVFLEGYEKEERYVVGTTSKTIFTLLLLYDETGDDKYLEAAKLGADWLLTMQLENGNLKSSISLRDGKWYGTSKQSYLYNGQVLSALSRIYRATGKEEYFFAADRIASNFLSEVESVGCYVGDDYRANNPISSSWLILALYDYYLASGDEQVKDIVFRCSEELLGRQKVDPTDLENYGRWRGSLSTSGAGWLAEVFVEIYKFCLEEEKENCDKYKDSIVKALRWTIQQTYSKENSKQAENIKFANGGIYWNEETRYVRTDAVCHGLNAYVGILPYLEEGVLISENSEDLETNEKEPVPFSSKIGICILLVLI